VPVYFTLSHFAFAFAMALGLIYESIVGVVVVPLRRAQDECDRDRGRRGRRDGSVEQCCASHTETEVASMSRWEIRFLSLVFNVTLTIHMLLDLSRSLGCVVMVDVRAARSGLR